MAHTDSGTIQDTYAGRLLMMPELSGETHVLIDCMKMMFVVRSSKDKCHKYAFLHLTGWLVLPIDNVKEFMAKLEQDEAQLLYKNTMQKAASGDHRSVCGALQRICDKIPVLQWTGNQLSVGIRNYINDGETRRRAAAAAKPGLAVVAYVPAPVRASTSPGAGTLAHPTGAPNARPKAGSTTGRVWDICDVAIAKGTPTDWKAFKKQILATGVAEGINESTMSVQFGKWKLASGF